MEAVTGAYAAKYGDSPYVQPLLTEESADATLRLEPCRSDRGRRASGVRNSATNSPPKRVRSSLGWDHAQRPRFDSVRAAVRLSFRAHICGLVPASDVNWLGGLAIERRHTSRSHPGLLVVRSGRLGGVPGW